MIEYRTICSTMIWVLTLSFCLTCCVLGDIDPCLDGNFELLDSPGLRGGACKMQAGNVICDRSIRNGWYKVIHEDDSEHRQMMEGIVSPNYCGTSNPIWLNGTHPVAADGIVNRTACVVGIHGYCSKEYDIQIKACGENEYVYYLIKAESCNEGYCFGVNLPCAKPNPCEEGNSIKMEVKEDRSTSCKEKSMSMCDNSLKHGWYRIQRNGVDMKMPTTCVDQFSCGTVSPIWLSGTEPNVFDKVVSRKACVSDGNMCICSKFYNIQIRNCSSYLVYNLTSTASCPERYCFGSEGVCKKIENEQTTKLWEYILAAVAGIIVLFIIVSIVSYILFKKTLRLKKIQCDKKFQEPKKQSQLEIQ